MDKIYIQQIGYITDIQDVILIKRHHKPDFPKQVFTFTSIDNQVCFPEVRGDKTKMLENLKDGERVEIKFSLEGSEKNGKKYNNMLAYSIKPV